MPLEFPVPTDPSLLLSRMAAGLVGSEILRIAAEIRTLKAEGQELLDLTVGDFSPRQFRIPEELERRIRSGLEKGETNYPPSNGMPELREAVQKLYARELGLDYPLAGIVVAGGTRPLIYATYRALVDPGETVVYPVPSWNNNHYCHLIGAREVAVAAAPEARFLPTAELLRPQLRDARLLALCSPLNPTGTAFDEGALGEICDLVLEENRRRGPGGRPLLVLYDQVYWMLTFDGVRHVNPVMLRPEMAACTIVVDGISKAFAATGLRVGFGAGPPAIIQRMSDILGHVGAWAPRVEQVATAGFLEDRPALSAFHRRFVEGVQQRLDLLHRIFQGLARDGLPVTSIEPMGAIYLTVQVAAQGLKTDDGQALRTNEDIRRYLLRRAGWGLVPFQSFAYPGDSGWFRCSVGAVGPDEIERAAARLKSALRALQPL